MQSGLPHLGTWETTGPNRPEADRDDQDHSWQTPMPGGESSDVGPKSPIRFPRGITPQKPANARESGCSPSRDDPGTPNEPHGLHPGPTTRSCPHLYTDRMVRRIGVHLGTSGGVSNAVERARVIGANTLQIFSSSPRMWRPSRIDPQQIERMRALRAKFDIQQS